MKIFNFMALKTEESAMGGKAVWNSHLWEFFRKFRKIFKLYLIPKILIEFHEFYYFQGPVRQFPPVADPSLKTARHTQKESILLCTKTKQFSVSKLVSYLPISSLFMRRNWFFSGYTHQVQDGSESLY